MSKAQFGSFVFNLKASKSLVRHDTMEGKQFTVVPMVMMRQGVLNGSNGPIFYPESELAKTPEVWNHKPVVVYHPTRNGQGISACQPDVISTQKIGVIMNTRWDEDQKRLTAEAWLEDSRVLAVDKRVSEAVDNEKTMELSTGLFTDNEVTAGEFEGRKYNMVAHNLRPDHLAVLPDKIGACSIEDGAGFIRNENPDHRTVQNGLAHETVRTFLSDALRKKFPAPTGVEPGYSYPYIESVYDDFVIYEMGGRLFKHDYALVGSTAVILSGSPLEVKRKLTYVTEAGKTVDNASTILPNVSEEARTLAILNAMRPTIEDRRRAIVANANPYHDERGRFTDKNGGQGYFDSATGKPMSSRARAKKVRAAEAATKEAIKTGTVKAHRKAWRLHASLADKWEHDRHYKLMNGHFDYAQRHNGGSLPGKISERDIMRAGRR